MRVLLASGACRVAPRVIVSHLTNNEPSNREELMKRLGSLVVAFAHGRCVLAAGGAGGHECARRSRQEGRRAHLVRRPLHVRRGGGSGPRLHRDVRHQGQRRAHDGAGRLSAAPAGHQEQPDDLRRLLLDRPRPLCPPEGGGPLRQVRAGEHVQDLSGLPELRSRRLLPDHGGRPRSCSPTTPRR